MYCEHPITYAVKSGDNLFQLSRRFKTTVQMILFLNPGINPYNLQIGSSLIICPGEEYMPAMPDGGDYGKGGNNGEYPAPEIPDEDFNSNRPYPDKDNSVRPDPDKESCHLNPNRPCPPLPEIPKPGPDNGNGNGNNKPLMDCRKMINLFGDMRKAWSQHVYWTRAVIISIAEKLADQPNVVGRLMQNPYAIAKIFNEFFPIEKASAIERLLSEHSDIGGRLVIALRDGQMEEANELNRRWYLNAEQLAAAFAGLTDYYDEKELCEMLFAHLEATTRMAAYRLGGSFIDDIAEFEKVENGAMEMADYLAAGIAKQFPDKF